MGRVEDALRRAGDSPSGGDRTAIVERHVDDAADEPFPIEMPNRRRLKQMTTPVTAATVEAPATVAHIVEAAVPAAPGESELPAFAALVTQLTTGMSHKVVIDSHMAPGA